MADQLSPLAIIFDPIFPEREFNSPLEKVYHMTLFERTLRSLQTAGLEKVVVVAGPNAPEFAKIKEEKGPWEIKIEFIDPAEVQPLLEEEKEVLILSEPLLVTPRYVKEIIASASNEILITDPNRHVAYLNQSVLAQLKNAASYDIEQITKQAEKSGIGFLEARSIGKYVCEPVPDRKAKRTATKKLIRSLRQPSDEFISRTFNRPISLAITSVIAYTPVTANQFTIFTGMMGLVTAFVLSLGGNQNFLIGGIMFQILAILDAGDGEIARLKFLASERGQWIDTIVDNITYVATLLGLIIGVYRSDPSDFIIYTSIAGVSFLILALLSLYLYLLKYDKGGSLVNIDYSFKDSDGIYGQVMNVIQELGRRPFFSMVFMFLGIFGLMEYSLVYVSIMTFFVFIFSVQAHVQASKKAKVSSSH